MRKWIVWLMCMSAVLASAADPTPKFPENKWFSGAKGYEEAAELQKQFQCDIFLYFSSSYPKDQAGLCSWFERHGLGQPKVNKLLRNYLKVQVRLPLGKKDEVVLGKFGAKKGPTVLIVQPDGKSNYCQVFEWPGGEPKLLTADQLVELFTSKSSPRVAPATP